MAIYHFSIKAVRRAAGSSAVAAAAYRSGSKLFDERLQKVYDFSKKHDVFHSEILLPENASSALTNRSTLWNGVEAAELRRNARVAQEYEFAIPVEFNRDQAILIARDFALKELVGRGMVSDLNLHLGKDLDADPKPHAHVLSTTRRTLSQSSDPAVQENAFFGKKGVEWDSLKLMFQLRQSWAEHVNARLAEMDIDLQVDHRSYRVQGIRLKPQNKIGPAGARRLERGQAADRAADHRAIARRNGERIIEDPSIALEAITHQQATFTDRDLIQFLYRQSDNKFQFDQALSSVKSSDQLVQLGCDERGAERYSSRDMLNVEERLEEVSLALVNRRDHPVGPSALQFAFDQASRVEFALSSEQNTAVHRITRGEGLSLVVGYAGAGKSALLKIAKQVWERQGYNVSGVTLSGVAAETLANGSSIPSQTLASLEYSWSKGRNVLTSRDVLVIDEAGLLGSRPMERILRAVNTAQAKAVLVGDPEQLQAIETGSAFRALNEALGAAEVTEVRRQRVDWQRSATRKLATGQISQALGMYENAGMVHGHANGDDARTALIEQWSEARRLNPNQMHVILAYTRDDVAQLNERARTNVRAFGGLGPDLKVHASRGERNFARGDRVMLLKNDRSLKVRNGALGLITGMSKEAVDVRLDDGRSITFQLKTYADLEYGYATTIHKSQGATFDRVHVLASSSMDRHAAYVSLSRHRESVVLHYAKTEFPHRNDLLRTLGRDRSKDMARSFTQNFASRRQIQRAPEPADTPLLEHGSVASPSNGAAQLGRSSAISVKDRSFHRAVRQVAQAVLDTRRGGSDCGLSQEAFLVSMAQKAAVLSSLGPNASATIVMLLQSKLELLEQVAAGRTATLVAALMPERDPGHDVTRER